MLPALLTVIILGSLRMLAGGYHFDTYGKCLLVTLALVITAALISQYTYSYWSIASIVLFLILVFAFSFYMLIKYAPKDTPTKPITDPAAIMKYKKLSISYLGLLLIPCSILMFFNLKMQVMAISFGVLLEVFTITPVGHSFFNMIKTGLNKA
jgi:accessory gene regulator B